MKSNKEKRAVTKTYLLCQGQLFLHSQKIMLGSN